MLVVVPVDPPHEALAPDALTVDPETPLSATEATALYRAAMTDVVTAVDSSGGDLLVNVRDAETLPDEVGDSIDDAEAEIRRLVGDALGDEAEFRIEPQVGSSRSARVGNTVTHLLEREDVNSVGVLDPMAALVGRTQIDGVAMSLRRNDVVLGPAQAGGIYMAAFTQPIDFSAIFEASQPPIEAIAKRAVDAGLGVGFAPRVPTIADERGLGATIAEIGAREVADLFVPRATAAVIEELGLEAGADGTLRR